MSFGKALRIVLLALLCGHAAWAAPRAGGAPPQVKPADRKNEQTEIAALIEQSRSSPPEFAADVLIRLAESEKLALKKRRALLEEAFTLSSSARQPFKLQGLPGRAVDTRTGYASRAFDLRLDALSLQTRAASAMLQIDKRRAREMFVSLPPLRFPPLGCQDSLVYDISSFYETLGALARDSFSAEEMGRYEHVGFVESYLDAMTSPVQLAPAAGVIVSLKAPASQFERLLRAFSGRLAKVSGDDRSFSYAVAQGAVAHGVVSLAEASKQQGVPRDGLLKATREFLLAHLRSSRCADNVNDRRAYLSDPANSDYYNKAVAEIGGIL